MRHKLLQIAVSYIQFEADKLFEIRGALDAKVV